LCGFVVFVCGVVAGLAGLLLIALIVMVFICVRSSRRRRIMDGVEARMKRTIAADNAAMGEEMRANGARNPYAQQAEI
jgi:hypothetical protein